MPTIVKSVPHCRKACGTVVQSEHAIQAQCEGEDHGYGGLKVRMQGVSEDVGECVVVRIGAKVEDESAGLVRTRHCRIFWSPRRSTDQSSPSS